MPDDRPTSAATGDSDEGPSDPESIGPVRPNSKDGSKHHKDSKQLKFDSAVDYERLHGSDSDFDEEEEEEGDHDAGDGHGPAKAAPQQLPTQSFRTKFIKKRKTGAWREGVNRSWKKSSKIKQQKMLMKANTQDLKTSMAIVDEDETQK